MSKKNYTIYLTVERPDAGKNFEADYTRVIKAARKVFIADFAVDIEKKTISIKKEQPKDLPALEISIQEKSLTKVMEKLLKAPIVETIDAEYTYEPKETE